MSDTHAGSLDPALIALIEAGWPDMAARLGERREAFVERVGEQARSQGLLDANSAARYLNLCFAFGPAFETRPENEWALALLVDERLGNWVKLHQLVHTGAEELARRGGEAQLLRVNDARLIDALDRLARVDGDTPPLPRQACDIEALEFRALDLDWRREYRLEGGAWQHLPGPPPPPALRVGGGEPAVDRLCLLSQAASEGPQTLLQVRQALHGRCGLPVPHPQLRWLGGHGLMTAQGHAAQSTSWTVGALPPPAAAPGWGALLLQEPSPELTLLELNCCGLRDHGVPLGSQHLKVWAWPAQQWLLTWQRDRLLEQTWPRQASAPPLPPASQGLRLRLARDGAPRAAPKWAEGLGPGIEAALMAGAEKLFSAWSASAQSPRMSLRAGLFNGHAAMTWGLREGAAGLKSEPLLRFVGDFKLGMTLDLVLSGEIEQAGARTQLALRIALSTELALQLNRDTAEPPLAEVLEPVQQRVRCPVTLEFTPLASETGLLWSEFGPPTGALVGAFGLRQSPQGGGAWQWFLQLALEPVVAPMAVQDPLLGRSGQHVALLGSVALLDWSLG
ncbi:hypothetical protein [Roseateles saccharophilus]|nr:hypothetical protein [Roseateles saccharophilus]MDG0835671.1 hypothetical protein [Roseateles saccharophilus]